MNFFQRQQATGRGNQKHGPELRREVLRRIEAGEARRSVAREYGLSESTVRGWTRK